MEPSVLARQLAIAGLICLIAALCVQGSGVEHLEDRRSRSDASGSDSSDMPNLIDVSSSFYGKPKQYESEKRQLQELLSAKNIFKTVMKLMGNQEDVVVASRNIINIVGKVLHFFKISLGQTSRSGGARRTKSIAEDVAVASLSMLEGYSKSLLASDGCRQRYLCQASRDATKDSREFGGFIAKIGGYATSYMLENNNQDQIQNYREASAKGLTANDCAKLYPHCEE